MTSEFERQVKLSHEGCPKCGAELKKLRYQIRVYKDFTIRGFDNDGGVWAENEDYSGMDANFDPVIECRSCYDAWTVDQFHQLWEAKS